MIERNQNNDYPSAPILIRQSRRICSQNGCQNNVCLSSHQVCWKCVDEQDPEFSYYQSGINRIILEQLRANQQANR
uniref:Uncharacterized protein n=1 Tax=Megaviridae environmental sample TaxID=1737588 RepID=A0A5J6VJD1_9VIRU|nr:MAG: hypothetical protein [Megaviridae environmental sample]